MSVNNINTCLLNLSQSFWSTNTGNLANLNTDANAVLYSTDGTDIKGDSTILKFEQDIKKLTVKETLFFIVTILASGVAFFNKKCGP
jgi:hypothetical protein